MADMDQELEALMERVTRLQEQNRYKSVLPLLREGLDRSRDARDFQWYTSFLFESMRRGHTALEPEVERDTAIEMISLLESEEAARRIQPDLDLEAYEGARYWYSSCAYDRLASSTMSMQGSNSEGMFGAIEAGVDVCHRTGKTRCIVCFRENGVDTSIAADDLELALNQALWLAHRDQKDVQHDRRVHGWRRVALVKLLEGDPRTSLRALEPAWDAAAEYHSPDDARLGIHRSYETAAIMLGEPELYEAWSKDHPRPEAPPRGECASDDVDDDRVAALRAAARSDWDEVEKLLTPWLAELDKRKHLVAWFEVARQLFASRVTAGSPDADSLAQDMLKRARPAREWFVERMVRIYRHPEFTPNPLGTAMPMLEGPWKDKNASEPAAAETPPGQPGQQAETPPKESAPAEDDRGAWQRRVDDWLEKLRESEEPAPLLDEIEKELIAAGVADLSQQDAAAWLQAGTWLAREGRAASELWRRANSLRRRFSDDATVLSRAADIGDLLRLCEADIDVRPATEELDPIYRAALALDPNNAGAHYSAGRFYEDSGNFSEAERCFARAFRLDRSAAAPALAVARIYRGTDRPRDALEALDVAIRHGCGGARVFWEAMVDAFELGLWERCISYGGALAEGAPDASGVRYYLAISNLRLEKWQEAIGLIDKEAELEPGAKLQVHVVHARALAGQAKKAEAKAELQAALAIPLPEIDYMAPRGLVAMHDLMLETARELGDDQLQTAIVRRARRAGLMNNDYYEEYRMREDNLDRDPLFLFEVFIRQPLPDNHAENPNTPQWEAEWGSYLVRWLVLAESEQQAIQFAMEQQQQAAELEPELDRVGQIEGQYATKPGVVEESVREGTPRAG